MYRVLIVDDEPVILEGLNKLINWAGFGLELAAEATDGLAAMDIINTTNVHIIVTDIKMPKMDGLDLIRAIKASGKNIKCIVLSGFDDFKYVKEAAMLGIENFLLKPINMSEMAQTLMDTVHKIEIEILNQIEVRKGINILRDNILNRWIRDDIGKDELDERASLLNIELKEKQFAVAIVRIMPDRPEKNTAKIAEKGLLKFAVHNICNEIITDAMEGILFCDSNDYIIILFCGKDLETNKELINELLNKCIAQVNILLHLPVFISMGSTVDKYTELHKSYDSALNMQEHALFLPNNIIVYYNEVKTGLMQRQLDIQIDLALLQGYIAKKNSQAAFQFIDGIFDALQQIKGLTPSYLQNVSLEILFTITGTLKTLNDKADALHNEKKDLYSSIYKFKTIIELKDWLKSIIRESVAFLESEDEKMSPMIKKVVKYVRENYAKEINLKLISIDFNVNTVYLGRLFKIETNETFTNYLNRVRIDKAKELLLKTDLKASEISGKIGYTNANYFYTLFKKITGVSPTEFKGE